MLLETALRAKRRNLKTLEFLESFTSAEYDFVILPREPPLRAPETGLVLLYDTFCTIITSLVELANLAKQLVFALRAATLYAPN
jgi:hypothetical protein